MSDSYRLGWPPGPHPDASGPEAGRCARCGHRADSHLHPGSCSVRGPLVAALPVQRLHQVGFVYSPDAWAPLARWPLAGGRRVLVQF